MKNYTLLLLSLVLSSSVFSLPKLNSFPSAAATIYLDFDGETVVNAAWNGGSIIQCAAPALSDAQVTEIFNRVSEDYRPFNVNITTDEASFLSAPVSERIRVIVTPSSSWRQGVGGISYIGSFTWGDDTPCFVFSDRLGPDNAKYIAECCSHESGHAVGLSHQSSYDNSCNLVETYNSGIGAGETGWAPVMGNSYYRNMTGWNDGPTPYGCANVQDNLTIITSQNGFSYRPDDFIETMNDRTHSLGGNNFSIDGLISTSTDRDAFKFNMATTGNFHVDATPFGVNNNDGANLDLKVSLYNAAQTLIRVYDPVNKMSVTVDTTLAAGTYYLVVDGTGNQNTSNYGSLGSYKLVGIAAPLAVRSVLLSGNVFKEKHNLSWNIVSDEPIKSQDVEWSEDGINFKSLELIDPSITTLTYAPGNLNVLYYRLKVISVIGQTAYSNIISLQLQWRTASPFTVSTFSTSHVTIRSLQDFQFNLFDSNGRLVSTGRGTAGANSININNRAAGLYIIQLFSKNHKQTERIIKQ